jgi:hypothetical protein
MAGNYSRWQYETTDSPRAELTPGRGAVRVGLAAVLELRVVCRVDPDRPVAAEERAPAAHSACLLGFLQLGCFGLTFQLVPSGDLPRTGPAVGYPPPI